MTTDSFGADTLIGVAISARIPFRGGKDASESQIFRERYGLGPRAVQPVAVAPPTAPSRGGLPTVINEGPVKVTLLIEVVKLKEASKQTEKSRKSPR